MYFLLLLHCDFRKKKVNIQVIGNSLMSFDRIDKHVSKNLFFLLLQKVFCVFQIEGINIVINASFVDFLDSLIFSRERFIKSN